MLDRIVFALDAPYSPPKKKGNGDKQGIPAGHLKPRYYHNPFQEETGRYFLHDLGCDKHDNCFDCPFEKCTWQKRVKNQS